MLIMTILLYELNIMCIYSLAIAFAIASPSDWNSLPDPVRNPNSTEAAFRRLLKTVLFARY